MKAFILFFVLLSLISCSTISLTMDRVNYLGFGSHIYGALYLYHSYPKNGDRNKMDAGGKVVLTAENLAGACATDTQRLPRVLVVGTSISMNYHEAARAALEGIAHYEWIEGNAGPLDRGVVQIAQWLGPYTQAGRQWDVIQFNHGLHDLKQPYDKKNDTWGAHQVAIETYKENLEREIAMMKRTGATLIWCTTTPVPNSNRGRHGGDAPTPGDPDQRLELGGV